MDTLTAQEAKDRLLNLIELSAKDNKQYRINSPEGSVVLLPWETYENLLVTLELLSTPGLMDSLQHDHHGHSCCHGHDMMECGDTHHTLPTTSKHCI